MLTRLMPAKLKEPGTLLPSVRGPLQGRGGELDLVKSMTGAAASGEDRGEPSWGVLAHLVRETRFIQVYRRLNFMKNNWSVPVDEYWADVRPFVADHRHRPFLETFALPPGKFREPFGAFVNGFDPTDLDVHEVELTWSFNGFVTSRPPPDWTYARRSLDPTARPRDERREAGGRLDCRRGIAYNDWSRCVRARPGRVASRSGRAGHDPRRSPPG